MYRHFYRNKPFSDLKSLCNRFQRQRDEAKRQWITDYNSDHSDSEFVVKRDSVDNKDSKLLVKPQAGLESEDDFILQETQSVTFSCNETFLEENSLCNSLVKSIPCTNSHEKGNESVNYISDSGKVTRAESDQGNGRMDIVLKDCCRETMLQGQCVKNDSLDKTLVKTCHTDYSNLDSDTYCHNDCNLPVYCVVKPESNVKTVCSNEDIVKPVESVTDRVIKDVIVTFLPVVDCISQHQHNPAPFQHIIKGAYKNIGVTFHKKTPQALIKPLGILREGSSAQDYLRVVSRVAMSGKPNYLGCRIQLHSKFNLPLWEDNLKTYRDKNVINLLRFGFPLGIQSRNDLSRKVVDNHSSA